MKRVLNLLFGGLFICLLTVAVVWAQATAQINGTARDQSGAVSSAIVLTAQRLTQVSTNISSVPVDAGNANPDQKFRFDPELGPGYIYNLKTTGMAADIYNLTFAVTSDPLIHTVQFQVR